MARKIPISHDPVVATFAGNLRQMRRSRGMTQRDFARLANLTESYVSRLEGGSIAPGIDLVARLARSLGCAVAELLPEERMAHQDSRKVVEAQAKHLFDMILKSPDVANVFLLAQILALVAESVERQRS